MTNVSDPLAYLASLDYRWGALQAIRYDPNQTDIFTPPFLVQLYNRTRASGRSRLGSLSALFCGMADLSCEAIVGYLHKLPVIVLGEWREQPNASNRFHPLGYTFPTVLTQALPPITPAQNRNFAFAGYTFFQDCWGKPQQLILSYLGIAFLFNEFHLAALGGTRYTANKLTARWMQQFGFRDLGELPNYLLDSATGDTTSATVSVVTREEFESLLGSVLGGVLSGV